MGLNLETESRDRPETEIREALEAVYLDWLADNNHIIALGGWGDVVDLAQRLTIASANFVISSSDKPLAI